MTGHTPMCEDLHRRSPRPEPCICPEGHSTKRRRKTPVDVPYIVKVRQQSAFAKRYGAKVWYAYPALARAAGEGALALRTFVGMLVGKEAAQAVPISLYRRVMVTARRSPQYLGNEP